MKGGILPWVDRHHIGSHHLLIVQSQSADSHFAQNLRMIRPGEYFSGQHIPSIPSQLPFSHSLACNLADMQIILSISSSAHTPQPPTLQISHAHLPKWRAVTQAACHTTYCFSSVTLEIALTSQLRDGKERARETGRGFHISVWLHLFVG